MAHFYLLENLETTQVGAIVTLDGSEGRHASTVSRVRVGEKLAIGNGRGLMLGAEVLTASKEAVELSVTSVEVTKRESPAIVLVQALAKTDRDERAVEACTELGISAVIPWAADRSVSKWEGPKVDKGIARWAAIVREATKQSIRSFLPEVGPHLKSTQLGTTLRGMNVLVLDPTGEESLSEVKLDGRDIALIVGPEGGITEHELTRFKEEGAHIVRMGTNILRTSTAGPAALAILNAKLGRC